MALRDPKSSVQGRRTNKEPEWSSICNNVFDQYLDDDDLFGFGGQQRERSSSDESGNLFDFSGSSEQSHQTDATSPIPSWSAEEQPITEAKQPKAKAPLDFWHKKLRALEQNAADCERRQQKLRNAKSHPDFLSLGGFPSPPAIPGSPTNQSNSIQRQKSRQPGPAANGRRPSTHRSVTNLRAVSRGRPVGVTKPPASAAITPGATIRKHSASPSKMMTPSRYRAGFKDVWAERIQDSPKKFELRLPSSQATFPASPPPSARSTRDTFAAFGSPTYAPVPGCDDQISPLASTFQQAARIHTPIASPLLSPGSHANTSYFEAPPPLQSYPYVTTLPLNDVAPLYPERGSSLATNKIQEFDFGFSSSPGLNDTWSAAPFAGPPSTSYASADPFISNDDPFGGFNSSLLLNQQSQNHNSGLGISCDPSVLSGNYTTAIPDTAILPTSAFQTTLSASPFYVPSLPNGLPNTPRVRQRGSPTRSPSPPATESRSRRASGSRRNSRHRRTKSASTTPRHHQGADKGGFVNFTPMDHGKILNGVAPSGSSKTKARREKEAAEKRRRLSQAAMKAVIEAGGDVETLQKAGLIV
ncbi:hypothetical protein AC579_6031 [Pseudocercospora musae]|uniref:Uncharacterized protein n=1 Tax=Pseudocercospora musae TaxID=113226 RepID=A0A139IF55_9PEZI|nr:hypothetical protein AC579_6031 [Pseudocercospora musae]